MCGSVGAWFFSLASYYVQDVGIYPIILIRIENSRAQKLQNFQNVFVSIFASVALIQILLFVMWATSNDFKFMLVWLKYSYNEFGLVYFKNKRRYRNLNTPLTLVILE